MTASVDAVVFDYGGVMTSPVRNSFRAWMRAEDIVPASLATALAAWTTDPWAGDSPVHLLETGDLEPAAFERLLAARLRARDGHPVVADDMLARAFAGLRPCVEMFDLVRGLKGVGVGVGLLSNSWGNAYPRRAIDELFDVVVISEEVGLRKPLRPIYELTLQRLGLAADRVVFVDDLEVNLDGAASVGMTTVHHVEPTRTRAELAALLPCLSDDLIGNTAAD